jgi:hypothetical protein
MARKQESLTILFKLGCDMRGMSQPDPEVVCRRLSEGFGWFWIAFYWIVESK